MTNKLGSFCAEWHAQASSDLAFPPGRTALPVWRASVRMALVSAASVVAAGLIATGCAGM